MLKGTSTNTTQKSKAEFEEGDIYYLSSPLPYIVEPSHCDLGIHIGIGNRTDRELRDVKAYFFIAPANSLKYELLCESPLDTVPPKQSYFGKVRLQLPRQIEHGKYSLRYSLAPKPDDSNSGSLSIEVGM